jgi:drug/metabolite transporter (DMT)-like permease
VAEDAREARREGSPEPGRARGLAPVAAGLAASGAMAAVGSSFAVLDGLRDYPAASGQALRYTVGALLLFAIARGRIGRPAPRALVRLALLAATGLAAFNLLVLAAEDSMDPGSVGVVVATVPVLLALAGPIQAKRRPQPRVIAAGAIVAAGAAAIQGLGGDVTAAGLAAALGALACEAAFSLLAAPLLGTLGPVSVSAWAVSLAVPMLAIGALIADGPEAFQIPTATEAASLAWLAAVVTALAFVLWYSAVRALGVERAGLFAGVLPVAALLCAAALGDSQLTAGRIAGVLAVAAGIAAGLGVSRRRPLELRGARRVRRPALAGLVLDGQLDRDLGGAADPDHDLR